jgi:hypothetical protein
LAFVFQLDFRVKPALQKLVVLFGEAAFKRDLREAKSGKAGDRLPPTGVELRPHVVDDLSGAGTTCLGLNQLHVFCSRETAPEGPPCLPGGLLLRAPLAFEPREKRLGEVVGHRVPLGESPSGPFRHEPVSKARPGGGLHLALLHYSLPHRACRRLVFAGRREAGVAFGLVAWSGHRCSCFCRVSAIRMIGISVLRYKRHSSSPFHTRVTGGHARPFFPPDPPSRHVRPAIGLALSRISYNACSDWSPHR